MPTLAPGPTICAATCSCPDADEGTCKHAAAALLAFADEVSLRPELLVAWRCAPSPARRPIARVHRLAPPAGRRFPSRRSRRRVPRRCRLVRRPLRSSAIAGRRRVAGQCTLAGTHRRGRQRRLAGRAAHGWRWTTCGSAGADRCAPVAVRERRVAGLRRRTRRRGRCRWCRRCRCPGRGAAGRPAHRRPAGRRHRTAGGGRPVRGGAQRAGSDRAAATCSDRARERRRGRGADPGVWSDHQSIVRSRPPRHGVLPGAPAPHRRDQHRRSRPGQPVAARAGAVPGVRRRPHLGARGDPGPGDRRVRRAAGQPLGGRRARARPRSRRRRPDRRRRPPARAAPGDRAGDRRARRRTGDTGPAPAHRRRGRSAAGQPRRAPPRRSGVRRGLCPRVGQPAARRGARQGDGPRAGDRRAGGDVVAGRRLQRSRPGAVLTSPVPWPPAIPTPPAAPPPTCSASSSSPRTDHQPAGRPRSAAPPHPSRTRPPESHRCATAPHRLGRTPPTRAGADTDSGRRRHPSRTPPPESHVCATAPHRLDRTPPTRARRHANPTRPPESRTSTRGPHGRPSSPRATSNPSDSPARQRLGWAGDSGGPAIRRGGLVRRRRRG